jgi:hypothetical protein
MSGSENNVRKVSTWDDDMNERERDMVEHWRAALSHVMTTECRRHGFQAPELDPNPPTGSG